jgi:myo-inositol-1-phosphate synthase
MHVQFGDYHVRDIEFVAAFDVDAKKVGLDLSDAIVASENNTIKIATSRRPASPCSAATPSTASASTTAR